MYSNKRLKKFAWGDYYSSPNSAINNVDLEEQKAKRAKQQQNMNSIGNGLNVIGAGLDNTNSLNETGYTDSLKKSKTEADALISGVGAINPIVGGFMKVGQGIGSQTVDSDGVYKNRAGSFIDNNVNPTTGIQNFKDYSKDISWETTLSQFSGGLLGESASQKRAKEGIVSRNRKMASDLEKESQNSLLNYPTNGYAKYGMKFPNGGKLPYPTDGSDYNTLSSDMVQYHGNTHENGGIKLDTNQDRKPDIEIENKEVIKDNMVFSDRLNPSIEAQEASSRIGFSFKKDDTYASAASRLGKKKGNFESKLDSTRIGEAKSAELMTHRLDNISNLLFEDQQDQNKHLASSSTQIENPRMDELKGRKSDNDYENTYRTMDIKKAFKGIAKERTDPGYVNEPYVRNFENGGPINKNLRLVDTWNTNPYSNMTKRLMVTPKTDMKLDLNNYENSEGPGTESAPSLRSFNLGDYKGDIAAGIGATVNQALISKLETNYDPELVKTPGYNYTNRLPYLTKTIDSQFRTASEGINGSSAQDNNALKANMYAKTLDALNSAVDSETQRKDIFDSRYNELVNRTHSINANLKNRSKEVGMQNRNNRLALTQSNIDNTIRSYMGNEAQRDMMETDFVKSYLNYAKEGDTGVANRLIKQLPKRARRKIGFE